MRKTSLSLLLVACTQINGSYYLGQDLGVSDVNTINQDSGSKDSTVYFVDPEDNCPFKRYKGREICDGIDNDKDGNIDYAIIDGSLQRVCPVTCHQNRTGLTIQEKIDYQGNIEERMEAANFCSLSGDLVEPFCDLDYRCIGEWIHYREIDCLCVDEDGGFVVNTNNIPARCE